MRRIVPALALLTLAVSVGFAGISVEFDPGTVFGDYETYAWSEGTPARRSSSELVIRQGVERELGARGLTQVEGQADVLVVTHALADRQSLEQLHDATYWEFVTGIRSVDAYQLGAGTLVVDIIDEATDKVVWRGLITGGVSGPTDKMNRKLDKTIGKLFRRLPD